MPVRFVAETAAPIRLHKRGAISSTRDWSDAMNAMRNIKKDQAIVIDMNTADYKDVKKPEMQFAYSLRRHFTANGIMATAYQSAPMQVTITHATSAPVVKKRK